MENQGNELDTRTKIEKIKNHIRENRKVYIGTSVGIVVGAVSAAAFLTLKYGVTEKQVVDAYLAKIVNQIKGNRNAIVNNNTFKTISMYGNTIGRPGTPIVDITTGHQYESITLAARALNVDYNRFIKNLNNALEIDGHKFIRLIEDV